MSVLTRNRPTAAAVEVPPAPLAVAGRLGPPRWLGTAVLGGTVVAFVVSAVRPKQVPPAAQKVADATSLVVLGLHPLEAMEIRRWSKKRGVAKSTRRRATFATLTYGVFGSVPAKRKIKKASR